MPRPPTKQPEPIEIKKIDDLTLEIFDWDSWPISRGSHKARDFHYRREKPIMERLCDIYLSYNGHKELFKILNAPSNFADWLAFEKVLGEDIPVEPTDIRKHWYPRIKREWDILMSTQQEDTKT